MFHREFALKKFVVKNLMQRICFFLYGWLLQNNKRLLEQYEK